MEIKINPQIIRNSYDTGPKRPEQKESEDLYDLDIEISESEISQHPKENTFGTLKESCACTFTCKTCARCK